MCACRSKCTYWMGATAPQRCELFVNYFAVYLTGRSSNWERSRGFCYHFAIKPNAENQKVVISLEFFLPKHHGLFIPTRSFHFHLKRFCLWDFAQILQILHIILKLWAIRFFVAILLPRSRLISPLRHHSLTADTRSIGSY